MAEIVDLPPPGGSESVAVDENGDPIVDNAGLSVQQKAARNLKKIKAGGDTPAPPGGGAAPEKRNFAGANYEYDPSVRGDENGGGFGGFAKQGAKDVAEAGIGAGRGAIGTLYHLGRMLGIVPHNPDFEASLKDQNAFDTTGHIAEQAAEYAGAEGAVNAGVKTVLGPTKVLTGLGNFVKNAATGAAVAKADGASNDEALTVGVISGSVPAIISGAGKGLQKLGMKIESSIVRPTAKDLADGFEVRNIFKYKLGGGIEKTAERVNNAIESRAAALKDEIAAAGRGWPEDEGRTIDLHSALADTIADLRTATQNGKNFGNAKSIDRVAKQFLDEIKRIAPNGDVPPDVAQAIKREVGNLGAWQYGARDPHAAAVERVANVFYSKLRLAIEQSANGGKAGGKIAMLNAQIGELLPIERAIIRRIPVAQRNNILNLGKIVLLGSGHPGLIGLEAGLKSGAGANAMYRAGEGLARGARAAGSTAFAGTRVSQKNGNDDEGAQ